MTERSGVSEKERELLTSLRESGVINFNQLGSLVAKVGPSLFDPGVAAEDYVVKGVDSVIHVYKLRGEVPGLENIAELRSMVDSLRNELK